MPRTPIPSSRRSSRSGRRPELRTYSWCCSTTWGSVRRVLSVVHVPLLRPNGWPPEAWPSPGSTPRHCAPPPVRPCSPVATITASAWAPSLTWPRQRLATTRCGPRRRRRWPRRFASTATRRPSSASATRFPCGRTARSGRSTSGPPAVDSSTSTASSAVVPTSGTPACTKGPRRSNRRRPPTRATT